MADTGKKPFKKKKSAKRNLTELAEQQSASKISKKSKIKHESDDEAEHHDLAHAIDDWTKEELNELIDRIIAELPSKDVIKYSTYMTKFDFGKVKFGRYSGDQCRDAWKHIVTRVRRFRTMTEVANEAKEWAKRPWSSFKKPRQKHPDLPKKPLTPFFRYFLEQRDKIPKTMSTTETAKYMSKKFAELSDKKKKKYKDAYESEMVQYRLKLETFVRQHPEENKSVPKAKQQLEGPEKAHTPFELFKMSKIKDKINSGLTKKDALEEIRKLWHNIDDKKRIKWIRKSLSDQARYSAELNEYMRTHPNFQPPVVKPILTKAEKELKDKSDGKPERPPPSGYNLYSRKVLKTLDGSSKEKMARIAQLWKELSDEERAKYNFEAKKASTKYIEEFETYLNSLPEESRAQALLESNLKSSGRKIKTDASGLVVGKKSAPKKTSAFQVQTLPIKHEEDNEDDEDEDNDSDDEEEDDDSDSESSD